MMENLNIKVSNISFNQKGEQTFVQLRFNSTNGQINIGGFVEATQAEFFAVSSSSDGINELARQKLVELLNQPAE
ncbi:hypothetical protein [Jeotgalibacillus haloalkalitolerans]|uniref:Uncharacterized protein n=1 Tax=Jeotgalibacillus haloalkalitolerans TaxID=3104292 RepID=A0ABU5KLX8_9BACL|nr:hypothetical protein [Jeotgalibacillus sp. HH7-29]MDZ5712233.1 hypothetical protein [Jeotgalibacillus sp. HH7-29]